VLPRTGLFDDMLGRLEDQTLLMANDPSLVSDPKWLGKTTAILAIVSGLGHDPRGDKQAPAELQRLDQIVTAIGADMVYVSDEYAAGLESRDVSRSVSAARRIEVLITRVNQADDEPRRLKDS
jgi:hypothetical protein